MTRFYLLSYALLLVSGVYAQKLVSATCQCDYVITAAGSYQGTQLKAKPGQTVCIQAGKYSQLRFVNFKGAPGAPIRFINCGGLVEVVNDS